MVLYPLSDDEEQPIQLALLDASDLTLVGQPIQLAEYPQGVAVDSDGSTAAAVYRGAIVEIIDFATGATRLSEPFVGPEDIPQYTNSGSIAFAPDGRLVLGTIHPELLFLDPADFSITATAAVAAYSAESGLDADVGRRAGRERRAGHHGRRHDHGRTLWSHELETPKPLTCARVAASTAAGTLYCGDDWGGIVEYDLATGMPTGSTFDPQLGQTRAIDLTADGTELLAIGQGTPTLSLWRTDGGGAVSSLGARGRVMLDGYGISGDSIVVAERPVDAHYQDDLGDTSVWAPTDDRTVFEPQERIDGMGWAGPHLLGGSLGRRACSGRARRDNRCPIQSDTFPDSSIRTWMSPDGDRVYMTNFDSTDGPGSRVRLRVQRRDGEAAGCLLRPRRRLPHLGFGDQGQLTGGHHPVDRQRGDDRHLRRTHREGHRGRTGGADRDRHHPIGRAARRAGRSHHPPQTCARWSAPAPFPAPAARSTAFKCHATVGRFSPPRTTTPSPCTTCRRVAGSATRSPLRPRSSDRARCGPMACSSWSTRQTASRCGMRIPRTSSRRRVASPDANCQLTSGRRIWVHCRNARTPARRFSAENGKRDRDAYRPHTAAWDS